MKQTAQILQHLDSGKPITQGEALRLYGVARLAARIFDIKSDGIAITTRTRHVRTRKGTARVAEYLRG